MERRLPTLQIHRRYRVMLPAGRSREQDFRQEDFLPVAFLRADRAEDLFRQTAPRLQA